MKPWREIVVPHRDVLEGTFQHSEFRGRHYGGQHSARPAANIRTLSRSLIAPSSPRACASADAGRSASRW